MSIELKTKIISYFAENDDRKVLESDIFTFLEQKPNLSLTGFSEKQLNVNLLNSLFKILNMSVSFNVKNAIKK